MDSKYTVNLPVSLGSPIENDEDERPTVPFSPTDYEWDDYGLDDVFGSKNSETGSTVTSLDPSFTAPSSAPDEQSHSKLYHLLHDRRKRPILLAVVVSILLLIAFIINAVFVIVSILDASSGDNLKYKLDSIQISQLCDKDIKFYFKGSIYNPTFATFSFQRGTASLIVNGTALAHVPIPTNSRFESRKLTEIEHHAILHIVDRTLEDLIVTISKGELKFLKFEWQTSFDVETSAFWIPISFTITKKMEPLNEKTAVYENDRFGLKRIHLQNNSRNAGLRVAVDLGNYGNEIIENYFQIEIPSMRFKINSNNVKRDSVSVGALIFDRHFFLSDISRNSPIRASLDFPESQIDNMRILTSELLGDRHKWNITLEKDCDCRMANWLSRYYHERSKNAMDPKWSRLIEAKLLGLEEHESHSLKTSLSVKLVKSHFQQFLGATAKTPIELSGFLPHIQTSLKLNDPQSLVPSLPIMHFSARMLAYGADSLYYPFQVDIDMFNMTTFGKMISGLPWTGFEVSGIKGSSYLSRAIYFRTFAVERGKSNADEKPKTSPSSLEPVRHHLEIKVNSSDAEATIATSLALSKTPLVKGWTSLLSWPKVNVKIGINDTVLFTLTAFNGSLSYILGGENPLAQFFGDGDPLKLKLVFHDDSHGRNDRLLSNLIRQFLDREAIPGKFFGYFEMNGQQGLRIENEWPGLDFFRQQLGSRVQAKIDDAPDEEYNGLHSPLSNLMAFKGLEVMGADDRFAYFALSMIGKLVQNGVGAELKTQRPVELTASISVPSFQLRLKRDDVTVSNGSFLLLESQPLILNAKANIESNWETSASFSVKSAPEPSSWSSFQHGFIDNAVLIRMHFVNSTIAWFSVKEYMDIVGSECSSEDQIKYKIKIYPVCEGMSFESDNLISRLFAFSISKNVNEEPLIYASENGECKKASDNFEVFSQPVLSDSQMQFKFQVDSKNLSEMTVNASLYFPRMLYQTRDENRDGGKKNIMKSKHLAEKFLIRWGDFQMLFKDGDEEIALFELQRGKIAIHLGQNDAFNIDFHENDAHNMDEFFSAQLRLFQIGAGPSSSLMRNLKFLANRMLMQGDYGLPLSISGRYGLYNLPGQFMNFDHGVFDLGNVLPQLPSSNSSGSFSNIYIEFDTARDDQVQTIPCLMLTSCAGAPSPNEHSIELNARVDGGAFLRDSLGSAMRSLTGSLLSILGTYQRPQHVVTLVHISAFNTSIMLNGVELVNLEVPETIVESRIEGPDLDPVDATWKFDVSASVLRDADKFRLLMKSFSSNDLFVLQSLLLTETDRNQPWKLELGSRKNLIAHVLFALTEGPPGSESKNDRKVFQFRKAELRDTSNKKMELQGSLDVTLPDWFPTIQLNRHIIEIEYRGFQTLNLDFPALMASGGAPVTWPIRVIGTKDDNAPGQPQAFEALIMKFLTRVETLDLSLRISRVLDERRVNIFHHSISFPPQVSPTDFIQGNGLWPFDADFKPRLHYYVKLYNSLSFPMYFMSANIKLSVWKDLREWQRAGEGPSEFASMSKISDPAISTQNPTDRELFTKSLMTLRPESSNIFRVFKDDLDEENYARIKNKAGRNWVQAFFTLQESINLDAKILVGFNAMDRYVPELGDQSTSFFLNLTLSLDHFVFNPKGRRDDYDRLACIPLVKAEGKAKMDTCIEVELN